jgi:hypothetical protein
MLEIYCVFVVSSLVKLYKNKMLFYGQYIYFDNFIQGVCSFFLLTVTFSIWLV